MLPRPGSRRRVSSGPSIRSCTDGAIRELFTGAHRDIVTTNGIFRPIALVDGRAVGTWGLAAGTLTIRLFEPITDRVGRALHDEAARVLRYLRLPVREAVVTGV